MRQIFTVLLLLILTTAARAQKAPQDCIGVSKIEFDELAKQINRAGEILIKINKMMSAEEKQHMAELNRKWQENLDDRARSLDWDFSQQRQSYFRQLTKKMADAGLVTIDENSEAVVVDREYKKFIDFFDIDITVSIWTDENNNFQLGGSLGRNPVAQTDEERGLLKVNPNAWYDQKFAIKNEGDSFNVTYDMTTLAAVMNEEDSMQKLVVNGNFNRLQCN